MIVVFDFDKTLTYKDTLFGFYRVCSRNDAAKIIKFMLYIILMAAHKMNIITNDLLKNFGVKLFLRGKSKKFIYECADMYSGKIILSRIYENEFKKYKTPYVISASFVEYLIPLFPSARIIGSEIEYNHNRVKSLKNNCYGEKKIRALSNIGINGIDVLYTDSVGDLPLAQVSKEINLVKGDRVTKCNDLDHFIKLAT